jgi:hypothetical protein
MGDAGAAKGCSHRLSVAHSSLHRPESRGPVRAAIRGGWCCRAPKATPFDVEGIQLGVVGV